MFANKINVPMTKTHFLLSFIRLQNENIVQLMKINIFLVENMTNVKCMDNSATHEKRFFVLKRYVVNLSF